MFISGSLSAEQTCSYCFYISSHLVVAVVLPLATSEVFSYSMSIKIMLLCLMWQVWGHVCFFQRYCFFHTRTHTSQVQEEPEEVVYCPPNQLHSHDDDSIQAVHQLQVWPQAHVHQPSGGTQRGLVP